MNAALAYVEDNLTGEIDYETLARIACCSSHNFFRMFSFIIGVSLSEYIRRRRLTLAALELQTNDIKIVDLAFKFGYDSPVSFSRAFQVMHGITPTEARTDGVTLKAYPRLSFQISIKGEKEMDYRIESKEAFQVFGIEHVVKSEDTAVIDAEIGIIDVNPSGSWDDCDDESAYKKLEEDAGDLPNFVNRDLGKVHDIFGYRETEAGTSPHMMFAFRNSNSKVDGYTIADIPAYTWAIFPSDKFAEKDYDAAVVSLYKRIYSEWFPTSSYEQVSELELELYGGDGDSGYVEIWLAVKKKV